MIKTEREVTEAISQYLEKKGFKIEHVARGRRRGVDIKATKNGVDYYFENEGNKLKDPPKQQYTHLLRCVGQICMRMRNKGEFYIGLPEDTYYRTHVKDLENALRKLNVKTAWLQENGDVKVESYS